MGFLAKVFKFLSSLLSKKTPVVEPSEEVFSKEKTKGGKVAIRDLNAKIPGAENFKYKEFVKSDTAVRLGIDNTPSEEHWQNIEKLAINVLQPVREALGRIRVTSGYRSKELNKAINGSKRSLHCFGYASDIEPLGKGVSLLDLLEWIYYNCDFRELIYEFPPTGWIHCGYVDGRNERQLKLKDGEHNYKVVSLNYIKNLYDN